MIKTPLLHCIYADDIRQESNGKLIIIGAYGLTMVFPELPAIIGKLSIKADLRIPVSYHVNGDIELILIKNEESISSTTINIDFQGMDSNPEPLYGIGTAEEKDIGITSQFNNLEIKEPSVIQMLAKINGDTIESNKLRIITNAILEDQKTTTPN